VGDRLPALGPVLPILSAFKLTNPHRPPVSDLRPTDRKPGTRGAEIKIKSDVPITDTHLFSEICLRFSGFIFETFSW
jgi:hypothetical protein